MFQTHKYCIEAAVLRSSWPLSQSQWTFVQSLKHNEQQTDPSAEQNEVKGSHFIYFIIPGLALSCYCA